MRSAIGITFFLTVLWTSGDVFAGYQADSSPKASSHSGAAAVSDKNGKGGLPKQYKDDEILVKFKPGVPDEKKKDLHGKHGGEKVKEFPELRLHHLKLRKGQTVEEAVKRYQDEPEVEYAEPNFLYSIQGEPGDPRFGELWALKNTGQTGGTAGADINATAAWDITTGSSDVVVAIIDTGIDYTHADLAANLWVNLGIDTINQDSDPFDDNGHGTHVAGTIGAVGNNGTGVAGVNWNVKLTACKFLGANGSGATDGAIQCLQYIKSLKDAGANIVATNNSWGGGEFSQALYDAINAQRDILFIAAAGNSGTDTDGFSHYPSSYDLPNIISVAATDHSDNKAVFSNYGRRSADLSAPGVKILSTLPAVNEWGIAGGYGSLSGTSMATPHVSGLAALLKAQDPSRDWISLKNLVLSGGDTVPSMDTRTVTGRRINAYGSLTCSGRRLLSAVQYPGTIAVGTPVTLSAVSIECGAPSGPVTVTLSGGEVVTLLDDGLTPDIAAGDGIYAVNWTPVRGIERLRFSSPAGTETIEFPSLRIATGGIPTASRNKPYRQSILAGAGYFPYGWSMTWGALPPGVTLNGSTGEITGTPSAAGMYHFSIQLTDGYGAKTVKDLSLNVNPPETVEAWSRTAYTNGWINIYVDYDVGNVVDIAVDGTGNAYVTRFGYTGSQQRCFHVVKYDPSGNEMWTNTSVLGDPHAIVVDNEGNVYVGGSSLANNYLVAKLDSQGRVLWTRERTTGIGGHDIAIDAAGHLYLTGDGAPGYLTVKFDPAGNEVWARTAQITGKSIWSPHIASDGNNNVYITGFTESSAQPNMDIVLMKYDAAGNLLWSKTHDAGGRETGQDLVVDAGGNIYVTGWSTASPATLFLMKFDTTGTLVWNRPYAAASGTKGFGLTLDNDGTIYVAGSIQGTPYSSTDFLTLKYDSSGTLLSAVGFDGGSTERGERLAIGPTGDIYVTGDGSDWVAAVTVKYDTSIPATTASPPGATYDIPQTVTLSTSEPATIRYTLDGSDPTADSPAYDGPLTITAPTMLKFFATDAVGHAEEVKTESYVILPTAAIAGTPGTPTNTTAASLTVSGVTSYRYSVDGGGFSAEIPVATPILLSDLAEGAHAVAVVGRDSAGNWQVAPTIATWTIDLTPPAAAIAGPQLSTSSVSLIVDSADVTSYRYSVDGGPMGPETPVTSRIILSSLADGVHTIEIIGRDSAGNWQVLPTSFVWTVDGWPVSLPSGGSFRTVAEAYAAVSGEDIMQVKPMSIMENVVFNRDVSVLFRGGYDSASGTSTGRTFLYGTLEIRDGTLTAEALVLMPPG